MPYKNILEFFEVYKEIHNSNSSKKLKLFILNRYKTFSVHYKKNLASEPSTSLDDDEKNLLIALYDKDKSATFKKTYFKVKAKNNKKCAFCFLLDVAEVDHFLPKNEYQEYSIFENNLLPICSKCNKHRSKYFRTLYKDDIRNNIKYEYDDFLNGLFIINTRFNTALTSIYIEMNINPMIKGKKKYVLTKHFEKFKTMDDGDLIIAYKENIQKFFSKLTLRYISFIYKYQDFNLFWDEIIRKLRNEINDDETLHWLKDSYINGKLGLEGYKNYLENIFINLTTLNMINLEPSIKNELTVLE